MQTTKPSAKIKKYRFSDDIKGQLRPLYRLDNWHGCLAFLEDATWVIGAIALCAACRPLGLFWPAYLLIAFPIIVARQRAFATLLHESAHGTLASNRRLNKLLGTYLSGYLIGQSFDAYFNSHVRDHHGRFGDPDRDPDFRDHIKAGLYGPQSNARFVWRYLVCPLFISQPKLLKRLLVDRLLYAGSDRRDILRALSYLGALTYFAMKGFGPQNVILFWYAPLILGSPSLNWYIELLEHFPYPATATRDLYATRHRALGRFTRHLLGIHNEGYHLDHHLTPGIPFWNLPRAHVIRMQDPSFAVAIIKDHSEETWGLYHQFRGIILARADFSEPHIEMKAQARRFDGAPLGV